MSLTQYLLFGNLLLLALGAVICFSYFVIKPMQTRWAIGRAREMVAHGTYNDDRRFRTVYRLLATAHRDLEATKLWRRLDEMKETPKPLTKREFKQLVCIIPPGGKF